jgi:disulfide bond formation protein DsbB
MKVFENLSKRHIGLPLTLVILYALFIVSLIFEYYLKYIPSQLCLVQRYCAVGGIVFVTMALLSIGNTHQKLIDASCVSLSLGVLTSGYHLLIQYKILPELDLFKKDIPVNVSIEELEAIIRENELTSCSNMEPLIFDLPSSAYVLIVFVFMFIYLSCCFKNTENTN